jgi:hypothetical protein
MSMSAPLKQSTQAKQPSRNSGPKPVDKFQDGPVHVSIWENQGTKGAFRTASFELRFKDSDEQWKTGRSYSVSGLKHLEIAAREARTRIESWQQANPQPVP